MHKVYHSDERADSGSTIPDWNVAGGLYAMASTTFAACTYGIFGEINVSGIDACRSDVAGIRGDEHGSMRAPESKFP